MYIYIQPYNVMSYVGPLERHALLAQGLMKMLTYLSTFTVKGGAVSESIGVTMNGY